MKWFGTNFGPICDDSPQVPVPVGIQCAHCQERIEASDSGVVVPSSPGEVTEHRECFLRQIIGSVGHQMKRCSCYGLEDVSEKNITRRKAAQRAASYFNMQAAREEHS